MRIPLCGICTGFLGALLATSLPAAEDRRLLPGTLDDPGLGVGDMHGLSCRQNISLTIFEVRNAGWKGLEKDYFRNFVAALNKRLAYLSGGLFSLDLKKVQFVDLGKYQEPDAAYYQSLEKLIRSQKAEDSFLMIVGPKIDGGTYLGHGMMKIALDELGIRPFNRKAVHELLHALISPAHSTSRLSTLRQYNFVIGLAPDESRFLNWPDRPPVLPDSATDFPD